MRNTVQYYTKILCVFALALCCGALQTSGRNIASNDPNVRQTRVDADTIDFTTRTCYSKTSLRIAIPTFQFTVPFAGRRIRQGAPTHIAWQSAFEQVIRLEYSVDGGSFWETISEVDPRGGFYEWVTPIVATEAARIRAVDTALEEVVAESGVFAIGAVSLLFITPQEGQKLQVRTPEYIQWSSDFLESVRIDLSTDAGATWPIVVAPNVDARQGMFEWYIDNEMLLEDISQGLLRISDTQDDDIVYLSEPFVIIGDGITDVADDLLTAYELTIESIAPHPATDRIRIRYATPSYANRLVFTIRDLMGITVVQKSLIDDVGSGVHEAEVDVRDLAPGVYFATITNGGYSSAGIPFLIIR